MKTKTLNQFIKAAKKAESTEDIKKTRHELKEAYKTNSITWGAFVTVCKEIESAEKKIIRQDSGRRKKEKEMEYEYRILKEEFIEGWRDMTEARFNYQLGQLNTLAGWTGNLRDYIENILGPIGKEFQTK